MPYQHRDLDLAYVPPRGRLDLVLSLEPSDPELPFSRFHASQEFKFSSDSRYAAEWLDRLIKCEPHALHVALVASHEAPKLWYPCRKDDPESPAAVAETGCVCWQTFIDPMTYLPVVAHHDCVLKNGRDRWEYKTFSPVALPERERLAALIIDCEADMYWVRTDRGTLHILPEEQGSGYGVGYGGGGPGELARMIQKIVDSDGYDLAAGTSIERPVAKAIDDWTRSATANRTQELTLDQLKALGRGGMVA